MAGQGLTAHRAARGWEGKGGSEELWNILDALHGWSSALALGALL